MKREEVPEGGRVIPVINPMNSAEDRKSYNRIIKRIRKDGDKYLNKDIEYMERQRKQANLALKDQLTSALSRLAIIGNAKEYGYAQDQLYANVYGDPISFILIDLDDLATHNDQTLDHHSEGDRLLIETPKAVKGVLKKTDKIGKIGGDEFFLVLPGVDVDYNDGVNAQYIAEKRIRPNLKENVKSNYGLEVGYSMGLASDKAQGSKLVLATVRVGEKKLVKGADLIKICIDKDGEIVKIKDAIAKYSSVLGIPEKEIERILSTKIPHYVLKDPSHWSPSSLNEDRVKLLYKDPLNFATELTLHGADDALYAAKALGKDTTCVNGREGISHEPEPGKVLYLVKDLEKGIWIEYKDPNMQSRTGRTFEFYKKG